MIDKICRDYDVNTEQAEALDIKINTGLKSLLRNLVMSQYFSLVSQKLIISFVFIESTFLKHSLRSSIS